VQSTSREEMNQTSSIVVRITAWYVWLFAVLGLTFGTYACNSLDGCLSVGMKRELAARAKEIGRILETTGQVPAAQGPFEVGFKGPLIAVHERGESAAGLSGQPDSHRRAPSNFPYEASSPAISASVVRTKASRPPLLIATVPATFGKKEYVVEVEAPKRPIKAVRRETEITMLIGLAIGLAFTGWGSCIVIKDALIPVRKLALTAQAFPVVDSAEPFKAVKVFNEVKDLCISINEMLGQMEQSFQIGTGLPAEAFDMPSVRLGTLCGKLPTLYKNKRLPIGVAQALGCLLEQTERFSEMARELSTPSQLEGRQTRTGRLAFYLGGFAAGRAQHICLQIEQLARQLASEARAHSSKNPSVRW
jgi:hypothetical protein